MCFTLFGRQWPLSRCPKIVVPLSSSFLDSKKTSKKLCVLTHDVRVFGHFRGNFFGLCTVSLMWFRLSLSTSIERETLYLMGHLYLSSFRLYENAILFTSLTTSLSSTRKVTTCFFFFFLKRIMYSQMLFRNLFSYVFPFQLSSAELGLLIWMSN